MVPRARAPGWILLKKALGGGFGSGLNTSLPAPSPLDPFLCRLESFDSLMAKEASGRVWLDASIDWASTCGDCVALPSHTRTLLVFRTRKLVRNQAAGVRRRGRGAVGREGWLPNKLQALLLATLPRHTTTREGLQGKTQ